MKEAAELETRKQIYGLILKNPGLNITKISELLSITTSHTLYHIRYLEKNDLISVVKEKGFTRVYIRGKIGVEDRKKISILRQDIPLKIVLFLLKNPYSKHKQIHKHFSIAASTLSYHLKKLIKNDIITIEKVDDELGYIVKNEKSIIRILIKYKPSRTATGMNDIWADFTIRK